MTPATTTTTTTMIGGWDFDLPGPLDTGSWRPSDFVAAPHVFVGCGRELSQPGSVWSIGIPVEAVVVFRWENLPGEGFLVKVFRDQWVLQSGLCSQLRGKRCVAGTLGVESHGLYGLGFVSNQWLKVMGGWMRGNSLRGEDGTVRLDPGVVSTWKGG